MQPKVRSSEEDRELVLQELHEIRNEILELATDYQLYWRVQREVIHHNARLLKTRSAFFDMLNEAYVHSTAARIRRLIDKGKSTISLRRLLDGFKRRPDLLGDHLTEEGVASDLQKLDAACGSVKAYVDQYVAHHDRQRSAANTPTHKELGEAVDAIVKMFKKYYGLVAGADIDVVVSSLEDPLTTFRFPWIETEERPSDIH